MAKSHSRPHTSNDNPRSAAQFKTRKYRRDFPARFPSLPAARGWLRRFFHRYPTCNLAGGQEPRQFGILRRVRLLFHSKLGIPGCRGSTSRAAS